MTAVVPCYEEAARLPELVRRLTPVLAAVAERWRGVLVVSAAARDGTPARAAELASGDPEHWEVRVQGAAEPGYGRAVALGLEHVASEWVFLIDGDLQLDPERLLDLARHAANTDLVLGRRSPRADPWPRLLASRLYAATARALIPLPSTRDPDCALKLMRTSAIAGPCRSRSGAVNLELLARAHRRGERAREVPVPHHARAGGHSRFEAGLGFPRPGAAAEVLRDVLGLAWRVRRADVV